MHHKTSTILMWVTKLQFLCESQNFHNSYVNRKTSTILMRVTKLQQFLCESQNFHYSYVSHKTSIPSCTKCSNGPYGPFWFSLKNRHDMETRYQKNGFGETWIFEISVKKGKFIGDRCCFFLKATGCVPRWASGVFFFWKMSFLDFLDMHIFEKVHFLDIWAFFQKWLPRPNHSAHLKGIEILCKTPVSRRPELPPGPNSIGTNSKYSSPARMSTWISRWLTAAAAAAASQELSPFGKALGVPRAGTKYPVQGNPSITPMSYWRVGV